MAINTQNIRVDLNPGKPIPVAYAHQNDNNREFTFTLYNNGVAYTPSGATAKFGYKSPIVNGQYSVIAGNSMATGTVSGNTVTVTLPNTYTQVHGVGLLTMILTTSGNTLRPVNIKFVVQSSADGDDVVLGASDWPAGLYEYMDDWLAENEPTEIANLKSDLSDVVENVTITNPNPSGVALYESFDIAVGDKIKITNNTTGAIEYRFRYNNTTIQSGAISTPRATIIATSTVTATELGVYFYTSGSVTAENISKRIPVLESEVDELTIDVDYCIDELNNLIDEIVIPHTTDGGGVEYKSWDVSIGDKIQITNNTAQYIEFRFRANGTTQQSFGLSAGRTSTIIAEVNADQIGVYFYAAGNVVAQNMSKGVAYYGNAIDILTNKSIFSYNSDLADVSDIYSDVGYTDIETLQGKIYAAFDDLVSEYQHYITKYDVIDFITSQTLSYPAYASGYRTYIYKFSSAPYTMDALNRSPIFLFAGEHGNEAANVANTYILMRRIIENAITDPDLYKLFSLYDFYVLPCLNGYGLNNVVRYNGNGVDINRNYPTYGWVESGTAFQTGYTGTSAGSEFETKVVMAIIEQLNPALVVDHHSYGANLQQFYLACSYLNALPTIDKAYVDCVTAFKKGLPNYFGGIFDKISGAVSQSDVGQFPRWAQEHERNGVIIEVSMNINYLNGEEIDYNNDWMGNDTMSVAEYTLRNNLMHLLEFFTKGTV